MANQNQDTQQVVKDAEDFLQDLKDRANEAHQNNNLFMLRLYDDLLKVASPVVVRAVARVEREQKADISKKKKALSKAEHERKQQERASRKDPN